MSMQSDAPAAEMWAKNMSPAERAVAKCRFSRLSSYDDGFKTHRRAAWSYSDCAFYNRGDASSFPGGLHWAITWSSRLPQWNVALCRRPCDRTRSQSLDGLARAYHPDRLVYHARWSGPDDRSGVFPAGSRKPHCRVRVAFRPSRDWGLSDLQSLRQQKLTLRNSLCQIREGLSLVQFQSYFNLVRKTSAAEVRQLAEMPFAPIPFTSCPWPWPALHGAALPTPL